MNRILIAIILLLIPVIVNAQVKITELTADTAPTSDDLTITVNDPAGTPGTRKVTLANMKVGALLANGANCSAGNYPLGVDASGASESCTADDDIPEAGDFSNLTGGTGITNSPTGTINTASGEADFLTSGALTCGASTQGKMQVHTTPLQYCDNAATPTLQYAAYGDSSGNASTGDSATSFFSSGTIEDARLPTSMADKVITGSLAIPQGTGPTVDAAGEIAVDTTDDQLVYYGGAKRVIPYDRPVCFPIESLTATDDNYAFFMANDAITITAVGCNCRGTCTTTATFTLEDRGGNAMTITGTNPTCATTGAATYAAVTAGNGLTAGEALAFDVTNTPTTGDTYILCFTYTTDAQ